MSSSDTLSPFILASRLGRLSRNRLILLVSATLCLPLFLLAVRSGSPLEISALAGLSRRPSFSRLGSSMTFPRHKHAYGAFLAQSEDPDAIHDDDDNYYVATRILAYQLLHAPSTKSPSGIPLLVLCTEDVSENKRARLAADGAIVVPVTKLSVPWIAAGVGRPRWKDVLTKLHLWKLTAYERVLFLDSDMLLTQPLDSIFEDAAANLAYTRNSTAPEDSPEDEGLQPETYVMGGVSGQGSFDHPWPPKTGPKLNAGFVMLKPSLAMFDYYLRVARIEGRFDPNYPEQELWNHVHRKDGNMPWAQLDTMSNVNRANARDATEGVLSLHVKWWKAENQTVADMGWRLRWEMEGAAEARDAR